MSAATAIKEGPILFSSEMVKAILAGRKTQTRRAISRMTGFKVSQFGNSDTPGYDWHFRCQRGMWQDMDREEVLSRCPYGQVGDRLWVRETFVRLFKDGTTLTCLPPTSEQSQLAMETWKYRATDQMPGNFAASWKPSIHMPRRASRITLEITEVRVERLQEISEEDAKAEGIEVINGRYTFNGGLHESRTAKESFRALWESINGEGSWDENPWLWVVVLKSI